MSVTPQQPQFSAKTEKTAPVQELHSDLAKLSLPANSGESYQKFAWADSVCALFLAVGLVGYYQPGPDLPPPTPKPPDAVEVKSFTPDLVQEPPPAPQPPDPQPQEAAPPDAPTMEAPAPVPVAEMSAAVQFSVPVEGPTMVVPVERAAAPSGRPNPPVATNPNGAGSGNGPANYQQSYGRGGMVIPKYPHDLEVQQIEGVVTLLLTVDGEGHALNVELEKKSGYREFDQEALRCARNPASRFNTPSAGIFRIEVKFQLSGL